MANLQGRTTTTIISGGYTGEDIGGSGGLGTNWVNIGDTGTSTATYYFTDSRTMDNANSSRVNVIVKDSWRVTNIDDWNNITITITTTVAGISRGNLRGSTSGTRDMFARQQAGSGNIWSIYGDNIATAHNISNGFTVGTYSYTIAPQTTLSRSSIYFRSNVSGHSGDPTPSIYVDEMWMGIGFKNVLPVVYIPGKILNNGTWYSHNRNGGTAKILTPNGYSVMTTKNGAAERTDPPYIRHSSGELNMRKIGQE